MIPHWMQRATTWLAGGVQPTPTVPLAGPGLAALEQVDPATFPRFVRESAAVQKYLTLLGELDWVHFPERADDAGIPGPRPAPRAPYVAAFLMRLDKGLAVMPKLREYLVEQPALVWLLGFPLVPSTEYAWGFDVEQSLPSVRQFNRVLRHLSEAQVRFLLQSSVQLLDAELAACAEQVPEAEAPPRFGDEISLDTKHIVAWVRENNPKEYVKERYNKEKQPKGDADCKLGCKQKRNRPTHDGSDATPTQEGLPARQAEVGDYYWGYASGVVATKCGDWGEFVLAEYTQTFARGDQTYFFPLMHQVEQNLGRTPRFGAFDAFYVYDYFHDAGGFAAVPYAGRQDHKKQFDENGLPLCEAGLAMPLKGTFHKKSHCLVPHACGRHACPLLYPEPTGQTCPIDHEKWPDGGCLTTIATGPGARIRHQLDRSSAAYTRIYHQRSATERINAQAVELGIERPKLRNQHSIARMNTLRYVLINRKGLQRIRQRKTALTAS